MHEGHSLESYSSLSPCERERILVLCYKVRGREYTGENLRHLLGFCWNLWIPQVLWILCHDVLNETICNIEVNNGVSNTFKQLGCSGVRAAYTS